MLHASASVHLCSGAVIWHPVDVIMCIRTTFVLSAVAHVGIYQLISTLQQHTLAAGLGQQGTVRLTCTAAARVSGPRIACTSGEVEFLMSGAASLVDVG